MIRAKSAVVTGAGTGIGKAISRALVSAGFEVAMIGRRAHVIEAVAAEIDPNGRSTLPIRADVGDHAAVTALFKAVKARWGRLDLLVNNAGIFLPPAAIDEISSEQWETIVASNLNGAFYCTQQAFRLMRQQSPQGGRIINSGSVSAITPRPKSAPYTATKHAITGLTKATALDGRAFNITCSQLDIGNAATDMTEPMRAGVEQADGSKSAEATIDPHHIAEAVLYIATLPLEASVLSMTIFATHMPFVGRG